jgi:hypothetical protein
LAYAAAGLPVAVPAVVSVNFIANAFREMAEPNPGEIALRQRRFGAPWGWVVAAWWVGQFVACVWIAETWTGMLVMHQPNTQERALTVTLQLALMFGASFAGNLFLLLAVQAAVGSGRLFGAIRSGRYLIDGAIVASVLGWRWGC